MTAVVPSERVNALLSILPSSLRAVAVYVGLAFVTQTVCGADLIWSGSNGSEDLGQLDASRIPISTGTNPVRYTNVASSGIDVVISTSGLNRSGEASISGTSAWYFEGPSASSFGASVPYGTVTIRFYEEGTTNPVGITGVNFSFLDAELGERFRNLSRIDASGTSWSAGLTTSCFYDSSSPLVAHLTDGSWDNGISQTGGDQYDRFISADFSLWSLSGFTFQVGRDRPAAGSVIMSQIATAFERTGEFIIGAAKDASVSAGPAFAAQAETAFLKTTSLTGTLANANTLIEAQVGQNVTFESDVTSNSGKNLQVDATQNVVTCGKVISLATTSGTNAGRLTVNADGSIALYSLLTTAETAGGGNITLDAVEKIRLSGTVDSSAATAGQTGGQISISAGGPVIANVLRSGGSSGAGRLGAAGNITVQSDTSIQINSIFANRGTASANIVTLSAPEITLGVDGESAAEIEGTLRFAAPNIFTPAVADVFGDISGPGGVTVDAGEDGSVSFHSSQVYQGATTVNSGTFVMNGFSTPFSNVEVTANGIIAPMGGVSMASLTMDPTATLSMAILSATTYNRITTSNASSVDGNFVLSLGGYVPTMGATFEVIASSALSGSFASYQGLRLSDRVLSPIYTGTSLRLVTGAIPAGTTQPLVQIPGGGAAISPGDLYDGLYLTSTISGGRGTTVTIIGGTASSSTTVTATFSLTGTGFSATGNLLSDIVDVHGTGTDKFVLQLDYDETAAITLYGTETGMYLSWFDGLSWVNAVDGNTDLIDEVNTPTAFNRAYDPDTDFVLGYYGVDTVNNRVWAVLDHNSLYSASIPEPAVGSLLIVAAALIAGRRRRA